MSRPRALLAVLLHGVRADRRSMLARALLLRRLGYTVLLIDLPAHGESRGERITFGHREREGVRAALAFLRRESPGRIGVIGVSLGAASLVLSQAMPPPDAVVLESMYPTIREAVQNRLAMRLGPPGRWLAPLLLWQLPLRLDVSESQLRPIDRIGALQAPVLIASGTHDEHTPLDEARRLHAAARSPKAFWAVEGAAHVDLQAFAPREYEARVIGFLAGHLNPPPAR